MAVYRMERTGNFTVMSNYHLRDMSLSLKAKGLMSLMLSLPEGWKYSARGLAAICKEGTEAVSAALRELEERGYVFRTVIRDQAGRIVSTEYVIYEKPYTENPDTENPYTENPDTENPALLNKEIENKEKENTDLSSNNQIKSEDFHGVDEDLIFSEKTEDVRDFIMEKVEYGRLCSVFPGKETEIKELIELITETICARRDNIRVAGSDFPARTVKERFLSLETGHIEYVLECLDKNTTQVRNVKQYLLTSLFNAPATMGNYYAALVNHDFAEG